jgi:hypothetical protein
MIVAPPPWHLIGDGFIWLFRFPRDFIARNGFLAGWQRARLKSTLGAVMLVDYRETNAGPYRELLFIPGQFELLPSRCAGDAGLQSGSAGANGRGRGRASYLFSISKIYVSTYDSVWNGIENWGIPKELAGFTRQTHNDGSETFSAMLDGHTFLSATLAPFGPRFPISSSLVPLSVAQALRDDLLITHSTAKGSARLCRVRDLHVDAALFPDISRIKPIAVVAVKDFRMTFPVPEVERGYFHAVRTQ